MGHQDAAAPHHAELPPRIPLRRRQDGRQELVLDAVVINGGHSLGEWQTVFFSFQRSNWVPTAERLELTRFCPNAKSHVFKSPYTIQQLLLGEEGGESL